MSDTEEFNFEKFGKSIGEFSAKLGEMFEKVGDDITDETIGEKISEKIAESFGDITDCEQLKEGTKLMKNLGDSVKKAIDKINHDNINVQIKTEGSNCPMKGCPMKGCPAIKGCPAFKSCPIVDPNSYDIDTLVVQYGLIQKRIQNLSQEQTKEFWGKYYGITNTNIEQLEEKIDDLSVQLTTLTNNIHKNISE